MARTGIVTSAPPSTSSGLSALSGWLAFVIPVVLACSQFDSAPRWEQDVAVVRALGLVQVGAEGVVSSALAALCGLLPLGSRLLRAALVNVAALGLASFFLYRIALRYLSSARGVTRTDIVLALATALLTTLSPSWQIAATRVGGPAVAALLVLVGVRRTRSGHPGPLWCLGVLLGCIAVEARDAVWSLVVWLGVWMSLTRPAFDVRGWCGLGAALVLSVGTCLLPGFLEQPVALAGLHFGLELELPTGTLVGNSEPLLSEVPVYFAGLAVLGFVFGVSRRERVAETLGWSSLVVVGLVTEGAAARLCALAGVAQLSMLGTRGVFAWVRKKHIPFVPTALRLAFVLHLCAVLLVSEDARQTLDRRSLSAARSWTNQAFESLPHRTLLLTESPEIAWRLWAARVTEGTRPDVTLVSSGLIGHGALAERLMKTEPALVPLIRDYAVDGAPSEYALSQLADRRPVRTELNYDWDRRLLAHLSPDGFWFRVAPHAVGRSDRKDGMGSVRRAVRRVLEDAIEPRTRDTFTIERTYQSLVQQALVAITLGDRAIARRLVRQLRVMKPDDPVAQELSRQLEEHRRGVANLRSLLRE